MKRKTAAALVAILAIAATTQILFGFKPAEKKSGEKQICYGTAIRTEDMHNRIMGQYDPNVYGQYANAWFKKYTLTVTAPAGWHFTGEPFVNCVQDNQGAFGWNNFAGARDRFFVTARTPNSITTTCWAGSRTILINLACEATKD